MAFPSTSRFRVEDFESLAPLSSAAKTSIAQVTEAANERPIPQKVSLLLSQSLAYKLLSACLCDSSWPKFKLQLPGLARPRLD